jgi:hypothetical protein
MRHACVTSFRLRDNDFYVMIAGLAASSHNRPDKRASAIEVAYRAHIPLGGAVQLAVLPKQYLEDGSKKNAVLVDRLEQLGIEWEVYDWQPNMAPSDYHDQITNILRGHFKHKGIL